MALRIATRGSALARIQAGLVLEALAIAGTAAELMVIQTEGDLRAPDTAWGEGAFVGALESALLEDAADIAVHSAKDMPIDGDPRLGVAAYLPREDPREALVVRAGDPATGIGDLAPGAVIGTDSPRRAGFLRAMRDDLVIRPLHGNVDTRLRRLDAGAADALVLAVAGLARLDRRDRITAVLDPWMVPPAPGQGAIAVQVRMSDARAHAAVAALDDAATRRAVELERSFLDACGGGCRAPVGAVVLDPDASGDLRLVAGLADGMGRAAVMSVPPDADAIVPLVASLVCRLTRPDAPVVLVTRPATRSLGLARALATRGLAPAFVPAIAIEPGDPGVVADAVAALQPGSWVVLTSATAARTIPAPRHDLRWAAVGPATAEAMRRIGVRDVWRPARSDDATVAAELPVTTGMAVLLVRGDLADHALPTRLRERGAAVHEVVAYTAQEGPPASLHLLRAALERRPVALTFASGSAVRGLLALDPASASDLLRLPAVCIGAPTAAVARAVGFERVLVPSLPTDDGLAEVTACTLGEMGPGILDGTRQAVDA